MSSYVSTFCSFMFYDDSYVCLYFINALSNDASNVYVFILIF